MAICICHNHIDDHPLPSTETMPIVFSIQSLALAMALNERFRVSRRDLVFVKAQEKLISTT